MSVNNPIPDGNARMFVTPMRILLLLAAATLAACAPTSDRTPRADGSVPIDSSRRAVILPDTGARHGSARSAPFRARGNEPGWALEIGERGMTLLADYGESRLVGPAPAPEVSGDTTRYVARPQGHVIAITVVHRLCHDGMSGFAFPSIVTVRLDGRELHGCGGERLDADSSGAPPPA